jgi:hypothetical protein
MFQIVNQKYYTDLLLKIEDRIQGKIQELLEKD